jgi:hypothetical protein
MKTFIIYWVYYGIRGAEEGRIKVKARSEGQAEQIFYNRNGSFNKDSMMGYVVEGVEEKVA